MTNKPTMQVWTDAWHLANEENFKSVYAKNALIFPPNKPTIQGNTGILEFMKGGLGKVDVLFIKEELIIEQNLAFEYGIFRDVDTKTQQITGEGNYSITWILENEDWKVQCHTWSMPVKK